MALQILMHSTFLLIVLALLLAAANAVDRSKFRSCGDTGFCRRHRGVPPGQSYRLDVGSITQSNGQLLGQVVAGAVSLKLLISVCKGGAVRVRITEDEDRWQPPDILLPGGLETGPYTLLSAGDAALPESLRALPASALVAMHFNHLPGVPSTDPHASPEAAALDAIEGSSILAVHTNPLKFELYHAGILLATANSRALMHFEPSKRSSSRRLAAVEADGSTSAAAALPPADSASASVGEEEDRHGGKTVVDYGEDGLAMYDDGTREERKLVSQDDAQKGEEEGDNFGGHRDSQPRGPLSVGMDFSFPFAQHVYGIPEHTSPLSLPTTTAGSANSAPHYSQPYRLYNLDVFEYELDQTMALYGHIPFLLAHGVDTSAPAAALGRTTGVFWYNPSETFIDIAEAQGSTCPTAASHKETHWISESGNIDFFLFPGSTPAQVYRQYTAITGRQQLPPMFSLGYHQCRWNYRDERDVAKVVKGFEDLDYPMDVVWLDIEHTDGKRYFTWDSNVFPTPLEMQRNVSAKGRRMVTIVDPHIKRDSGYSIHKEAEQQGLYIKNKDGGDFDGWCWPGSSSYLDFTTPRVRAWWGQQFGLDKYIGSTMDLFTWNDMNEPSVFNGPEVSMPKDAQNLDGIEHREWHNLYGLYMQRATAEGLADRTPLDAAKGPQYKQRPFVLSRAFWAGSQKYGAIWTGDNTAEWGHLKIASPMLLSINLAGLSFAGSDVGGFFGEPGAELFTRWYQAGSFTPFFRGHAHHDTRRREPWVFGEPYTTILRAAAMVRYSLLPYWYTVFFQAYTLGLPVMRTMFSEFPHDAAVSAMQDQWMVGAALLVAPVTDSGRSSVDVYLPRGAWYNMYSLARVEEGRDGTTGAGSGVTAAGGRHVTLQAPLETMPALLRGGHIVPRKMRLRRSSKLMFFDPLTLVVAPSDEGRAEGRLYLDDEISMAHEDLAGGHFSYRCEQPLT